ncbi:MAG TPA: phosphoribosyl-ATP diphosphatase [Alphaproteobacteria bacterium]|nr:phosphoribosyl-ATP diphosphatase [Alphaproteobacteria bacterium]
MSAGHAIDNLFAVIDSRRGADPESSYTAKLFARGTAKIAQKVGEEAVETVIEGMRGDRERLVAESADLLYHLTVLWADQGIRPEDVWTELASRAKPSKK